MENPLLAKDLYWDQLKDITFSDIKDYCKEKIGECMYLDYKTTVEETKGIAKDVAAMANAEGGIILIGVKTEERPGKPGVPLDIVGVADPEGIRDRISKTCATAIKPRLVPDMLEYEIPHNKNKFVILLRIPQSVEAPHWMGTEDSCTVPIRTNDFTIHTDGIKMLMPNDLVSYAKVKADLLDRSRKLLERASVRAGNLSPQFNYLSMGVVPQYPRQRLCDLPKLLEQLSIARNEFHKGSPKTGTAHESVYLRCDRPRWNYLEITAWGSISECIELETDEIEGLERIHFFDAAKSAIRFLRRANDFYRSIDFSGLIHLEIQLNFSSSRVPFIANGDWLTKSPDGIPLDTNATFSLTSYTGDLLKPRITKQLISELLFCCGLGKSYSDDYLNSVLANLELQQ